MRLVLNPDLLLAGNYSCAVSRRDGRVFAFTPSQRIRLGDVVSRDGATVEPGDLPLIRDTVLVLADVASELRSDVAAAIDGQWRTSGLLVVMPTERCNFRCTYCYETFLKPGMPAGLVDGVISYLWRNMPQFRTFDLAWFGGEPLLQLRTVERVSQAFREIQERHGTRGTISVTTNGYGLTSQVVPRLTAVGIDVYQITVDGPREVHDLQRPHIRGTGTYDKILENVDRVLTQRGNPRVVLRVNVDPSDAATGLSVRQWLEHEIHPRYGAFGPQFEVHVVPIWQADTTAIDGICLTDLSRFQVWANVLTAAIEDGDLGAYLAGALSKLGGLACYAGRPHSYVIGADGAVYKCTVALDLPENRVGTLHPSGELTVDSRLEQIWTGSNALTDPVCGKCVFARSCQGIFCPLLRLQTATQPCPTEKRFADALLGTTGEVA